jgi:hypothetical protein
MEGTDPPLCRMPPVGQCDVTGRQLRPLRASRLATSTLGGLSTWYEVRGKGSAVVLHGAFSGAAGWLVQAPAFVSAGFACMCLSGAGTRTPATLTGR